MAKINVLIIRFTTIAKAPAIVNGKSPDPNVEIVK